MILSLKKRFYAVAASLVLLSASTPAVSEEGAATPKYRNFVSESYNEELGLTEIKLKNGMKVVLKPTTFDEDEVVVQFLAPGGYATLDKYSRISGCVAAAAAVESGLGNYSFDQLTSLEYEKAVEITPQIEKFYRTIGGSCTPESVDTALNIVKMIFEKDAINQSALQHVIRKESKNLESVHKDGQPTMDEVYFSLNSQNFRAFRPLACDDLKSVDFNLAEKIYVHSFSQPREFIGVLVGNFDVQKVKAMIDKSLGALANTEEYDWARGAVVPCFPPGVIRKDVVSHRVGVDDASTWITVPIPKLEKMSQLNFSVLQLATKVLELRLRKVCAYIGNTAHCVDVCYDLPMFPYLNPVWINVRFRCPTECVPAMEQAFIKEMARLKKEGPTDEELNHVRNLLSERENSWKRDNCYWHSRLINCYTWGWDPNELFKDYEKVKDVDNKTMIEVFNYYFSLDNYTVIHSYPR